MILPIVLPPVNFADISVFNISIIRRHKIEKKERSNNVTMCCLLLDIFLSDLWSNLFLVISLKPYKHKSLGEIF